MRFLWTSGVIVMSDFFYVLDDEARLLFVDDDPILREFARVNLSSAAAVAEAAAAAAAAAARAQYDNLLDLPSFLPLRVCWPGALGSAGRANRHACR